LGHIGTRPCAIELTIADAIKFNNSIGIERKEARLRYLKNYWAEKVAKFPGTIMNTPMEDNRSCGLANVGIESKTPSELVDYLYDKHKIFTVAINAPDIKGARIAPNIYTTLRELDVFVEAMRELCYS
ncbi:MAG: aminotransferase, partial [bacterium]|nr:aminotransferase [bacterium]